MKLDVPYAQASMKLEVNDDRPIDVVSPRWTPPDPNSISTSLSNPHEFPDLASFLSNRKRLLVVINDHTRPTPTAEVLEKLQLKEKEVTTIVASGAHRAPSHQELSELLGGPQPLYGGKVIVHDSRDPSQLKSIGRTSRGTKLAFNKRLFQADGIIVIGSVEPHYYAGFTGGRKFLLPALAGFRSIEMNHSLALDERSTILRLEGNPVHDDFMEALHMFNRYDDIFSIQLVLNRDHQVSFAQSGHIIHSFTNAVEAAKGIYVTPVDAKADIIITVARPPMDLDLYQAHKAIENVRLALKDQGVVILVSPCRDGIGPRGYYDLLSSGGDVFAKIRKRYRLGYHKAAKLVQISKSAKLLSVTDLPQRILGHMPIGACEDVQTAVDEATKLKGKNSRVLVVLDGCLTVPLPRN